MGLMKIFLIESKRISLLLWKKYVSRLIGPNISLTHISRLIGNESFSGSFKLGRKIIAHNRIIDALPETLKEE
jgi:hypothetical protein